jgi:Threonyl-tRNA synthetase
VAGAGAGHRVADHGQDKRICSVGGAELREAGFRVETNLKSDKIGAKIRDAQLQKIPYMVVLGDKELEEQKVAVRERKQGDIGQMSLAEFLEMIKEQKLLRAL